MFEKRIEGLIVGAGPVGMTAALLVAGKRIGLMVIDEESGPAAHSYACALHPRSLELFERLGLADELIAEGCRVESVGLYDGTSRKATVPLSKVASRFPFALVLPQNVLEEILERALHRRGVKVRWNHRLSDLELGNGHVLVSVDVLGGTGVGYIVPRWETVVKRTTRLKAEFVIGADGHSSVVRQRLAFDYDQVGAPELFHVFEFTSDDPLPKEMRVVFSGSTTSVWWPLPKGRGRWSFQLQDPGRALPFPDKERRALWLEDPKVCRQLEQRLSDFVRVRAPWFMPKARSFDWAAQVRFERAIVNRFGMDRCWLLGDSAHQTSPGGVQSLNLGLKEADEFTALLEDRQASHEWTRELGHWERRCRSEWLGLFGLSPIGAETPRADTWIREHQSRIVSCLPVSGDHLACCVNLIEINSL